MHGQRCSLSLPVLDQSRLLKRTNAQNYSFRSTERVPAGRRDTLEPWSARFGRPNPPAAGRASDLLLPSGNETESCILLASTPESDQVAATLRGPFDDWPTLWVAVSWSNRLADWDAKQL